MIAPKTPPSEGRSSGVTPPVSSPDEWLALDGDCLPVPKLDRAFHERAALDLLARHGLRAIWKLHLDAAEAYRGGYMRGAQILIATADAAERLIRLARKPELLRRVSESGDRP